MDLDRLLNEANARGVRTRDALLALADEIGVEATAYDEDGAQLYLDDDSEPVVHPEGPPGERWTWSTGRRSGRARTNGAAFSAALQAAGAGPTKRPSGPSGKRSRPLCTFTQDPEDLAQQQRAAAAEGVTWADWIRDAARRKLEVTRSDGPREGDR